MLKRSGSLGGKLSVIPEHDAPLASSLSPSSSLRRSATVRGGAISRDRGGSLSDVTNVDPASPSLTLRRTKSLTLFRRLAANIKDEVVLRRAQQVTSEQMPVPVPIDSGAGVGEAAAESPLPTFRVDAGPSTSTPNSNSANVDDRDQDRKERASVQLLSKGKSLYQEAMQQNFKSTEGLNKARRLFLAAYDAFAELGDATKSRKAAWKVANLTADLGYRAAKAKDHRRACRLFLEARSIFQRICELNKEATCLQQLGLAHIAMGETRTAADYLKNAFAVFVEADNIQQEASTLCELANLLAQSEPTSSILFYKQALLLFCKLRDSLKEARTLYAIAKLCSHRREYASAFAYYLQARVIFRRLGEHSEKFVGADADCSYALGKLAAKGELFPAAVTYLEEATILYREARQSIDEAWALYRLALVMQRCGDSTLAIDYLLEARQLFAQNGQTDAQASCCIRIAETLKDREPERARNFYDEASHFIDVTYDPSGNRMTRMLQKSGDRQNTFMTFATTSAPVKGTDAHSSVSASPLLSSKAWWTSSSASLSAQALGDVSSSPELMLIRKDSK